MNRRVYILTIFIAVELTITIFLAQLIFWKHFSVSILDTKYWKITPHSNYKYFYEGGKNQIATDKKRWMNQQVFYNLNLDGLHNLKEYSIKKDKGTVRIAALGDSFTFGLYVNTKDNWVSLLEKNLNKVKCNEYKFEILNLGTPGYDINYTIERSKLRAEKYNPDVYVWFIKDDDFSEPKELSLPLEKKINKSGEHTLDIYMKALQLMYKDNDKSKIIKEEISNLFNYIRSNRNTKFLIILPSGSMNYPRIDNTTEQSLREFGKSNPNVEYTTVKIIKEETFIPNDFHFNEKGHNTMAKNVQAKIEEMYCEK